MFVLLLQNSFPFDSRQRNYYDYVLRLIENGLVPQVFAKLDLHRIETNSEKVGNSRN